MVSYQLHLLETNYLILKIIFPNTQIQKTKCFYKVFYKYTTKLNPDYLVRFVILFPNEIIKFIRQKGEKERKKVNTIIKKKLKYFSFHRKQVTLLKLKVN